jgi:hypothetical protein
MLWQFQLQIMHIVHQMLSPCYYYLGSSYKTSLSIIAINHKGLLVPDMYDYDTICQILNYEQYRKSYNWLESMLTKKWQELLWANLSLNSDTGYIGSAYPH